MEMEPPPVPAIPTPVVGIVSTVPSCSEKHCRRRVSLCDRCLEATRARSLSHGVAAPRGLPGHRINQEEQSLRHLGEVSTRKEIPTSVRSRLHSSMGGGRKSSPRWAVNNTPPGFPVLPRRHEHVRSQHLAETPQTRAPPTEYFNRRGEILTISPFRNNPLVLSHPTPGSNNEIAIDHKSNEFLCVNDPQKRSLAQTQSPQKKLPFIPPHLIPPHPVKLRGGFIDRNVTHIDGDDEPIPEAEDDVDLENLELKYPEVPEVQTQIPRSIHNKQPEHLPATEHPMPKRRKLSPATTVRGFKSRRDISCDRHCFPKCPSCVGRAKLKLRARINPASPPMRPLRFAKNDRQTSSAVQDSGQSNQSSISRKRSLMFTKKDPSVRTTDSNQTSSAVQNPGQSNQGSISPKPSSMFLNKNKRARTEDSKQTSSAVQDVGQFNQISNSPKSPSMLPDNNKYISVADRALNARRLFTSRVYEQESSISGIGGRIDPDELVETEASSSKSTTPDINLDKSGETQASSSKSATSPLKKRFKTSTHISDAKVSKTLASNSPEHIYGWDSDLSDLTECPEKDSESESSSEEQAKLLHPSVPTGLKIRIPPRPSGAYTLKCSSHRCDRLLPTASRWKSCVLCRARSRDYRRRKQNLPRIDLQLEDELMDSQSMGTPLAAELVAPGPKAIEFVPGARLCAIRTCTFVIPPFSEYRWTMCSLCRIRRSERRKQEMGDANSSPTTSSRHKVIGDANSMLQFLNSLTRLEDTAGRQCRSLDCGVMASSPYDCRQCTARRLWLVNRTSPSHTQPGGPKLLHRGSKKPMERGPGPTPYQQFKCFSAVLLEFKNRLSGFLRVQSIFFLFNQPPSTNALFAFDGEFSVVARDFDLVKRKDQVDADALKLKREIEYVGRIRFSPKRLISMLEGGGISIRFSCFYPVPILRPKEKDGQISIMTSGKNMQCELEIAVLPDHSHPFIPGQRTVIRFRLFG